MYVRHLELDNFKSFGELQALPLYQGFTAISGPNGSGKSNIIDAMLFVLGLSNNRTMRAERVTDFLNNSSGKDYTRVCVTLQDDQQDLELKIARRVRLRKNGHYDSTYYLNDKACTLAQLHDTLSGYGISPQGYNVVMQGDVTSIIAMSAMDRRKIVDELAGVAQFDRKIADAKEEIYQAQGSLERQQILLAEYEQRADSLRRERDKAVQYSRLRGRRNYLEKMFREVRIRELEESLAKAQVLQGKHAERKAAILEELGQVKQSSMELNRYLEELDRYLTNELEQARVQAQDSLDKVKQESSDLKARLEYLDKQAQDYRRQAQRLEKESELEGSKQEERQSKLSELEERETQLNSQLAQLTEEYEALQQKILALSHSGEASTGRVMELQEESVRVRQEISQLTAKRDNYHETVQRLDEQAPQLQQEYRQALQELEAARSDRQWQRAEDLQGQVDAASSYVRRLRQELADTEAEMHQRRQQLHKYQQEASQLEVKRQVAEAQNWGRTIDTALSSGLRGIHGVVAELATVPEQYATALETAAGSRLRAIVVDDEDIGARLIEHLRHQNAGRATFLPLSKLREPVLELPPNHVGVIDFAINLLQCDELYLPAFAYALGGTLVVRDVAAGKPLMGRHRMVTLSGDLLEKSGAMTGGSSAKQNQVRFGRDEQQQAQLLSDNIAKTEERIAMLQASVDDLKRELANSESELDSLKGQWADLRAAAEVSASEHKNLRKETERLRDQLHAAHEQREQAQNQIRQLDEELSRRERQAQDISEHLVSESSRIQNTGLEDMINRSQELEYERKQLSAQLKNLEADKNQILRELESHQATTARNGREAQQAQAKAQELEASSVQERQRLEGLEQDLEAKRQVLQESNVAIREATERRNQAAKDLTSCSEKKTSLEGDLKRTNEDIANGKTKISDLEERLDNLRQEDHREAAEEHADERDQYLSKEQIRSEIDKLERKMAQLEPVNMKAIEEFEEVSARLEETKQKVSDLESERSEIERRIEQYNDSKYRSFFEAFNAVNGHFRDIFATLSYGQGELQLENPSDPFSGGLIIRARPRNKKMQRLESMSGGEKSLTALSFIFALQWHNPAPFYAFDEVDMFLDGPNAERLARMIKQQSHLAQFIVVSLRRPALQECERAVGVCLGADGYSKVTGLRNKTEATTTEPRASLATRG